MQILIADDHELVRDLMAAALTRAGGIAVTQSANHAGVLARIRRHGPFDLVLLDYAMPGMNGLDGLRAALAANGGNPVALLSGTADHRVAERALAAGAAGFVPKTMPAASLANAVRFMAAGETYAPASALRPAPGRETPLTAQELDVLRSLVRGATNKEIARRCGLSAEVVKRLVGRLCRKLGARNRTQAAMLALDRCLL